MPWKSLAANHNSLLARGLDLSLVYFCCLRCSSRLDLGEHQGSTQNEIVQGGYQELNLVNPPDTYGVRAALRKCRLTLIHSLHIIVAGCSILWRYFVIDVRLAVKGT